MVSPDGRAELDAFFAAVARRESPRLMIFAPPRHGKSPSSSPAAGRPSSSAGTPDLSIIATSYADSLAGDMNRDVQRIIDGDEYRSLFPATRLGGGALRNSDVFEINGRRGRYRSAGVGGGITGQGAGHLLIIDDPVKRHGAGEQSDVSRQRLGTGTGRRPTRDSCPAGECSSLKPAGMRTTWPAGCSRR